MVSDTGEAIVESTGRGLRARLDTSLRPDVGRRMADLAASRRAGVPTSVGAFFGQLGLNVAWPVLFFGLRRPGMALGEILVLWGVLAWMQVRFWGLDAVAGWLWLPYLLWVTFACALNMATWKLNS
jgi:tryptophan-rich sensory protein